MLNPGLIGGLVLPIMGAVPDGAIVLFSGLGANAQEQLKVGVGTLAVRAILAPHGGSPADAPARRARPSCC